MNNDKMKKQWNKQHIIPWIGGLKDLWSMTSVYFSGINLVLIAITAWGTVLGPMITVEGASFIYIPWMNSYYFLGLMILLVFIAMFVEYKFVYPSYFAFRNKQEYKHQNPIRGDIKKMSERFDKRFKKIEEALGIEPEQGGRHD